MVSFFHAYDLRGTYPDEVSEQEAERVGKAYGTYTDAGKVLVGRDGRTHSPKITDAFIEGVLSTGTDVLDAGMVPTPVVYFGMVENNIDGSAVVTASHNPPEYTGFKFSKTGALAMSREGGMNDIEDIYESNEFSEGEGEREDIELVEDYVDFIKDALGLEEELDLVVNFGNGVTGPAGRRMLEALGCTVEGVNEEVDGEFPNHLPAPGEEDAQEQLTQAMGSEDLGILFDGDGDRAGFILPGYGYIAEDELMALFAEETLERDEGVVLHDLRASKLLHEVVENNGGETRESRVGHTFLSQKIHGDDRIVFAGELSGHYYFPSFGVPWDDGLFSAALMCQMVSEKDLEDVLESYPEYPVSPELRIDCPEKAKKPVIEDTADYYSDHRTSTIDGVKIYFEDGWALVRPSNTEEKMSIRCEGDTEDAVDRILTDVKGNVERSIERHS
ncbi:MAG: phosphomannomutase/phosphoglucomutase [Candidatus Nanohaloarchaea archaeon]